MLIAKAVRGMHDLFENELSLWRYIEQEMLKLFMLFGYNEIRTPLLEEVSLFKRGLGDNTDIVEKEMFLLKDGEHEYCLRPENTAPLVRALLERGGISSDNDVEKFFYLGPMFRKDRPQKGRLRQFHQFGLECFHVEEPIADVEIILMVSELFKRLNIEKNVNLKINSLGNDEERQAFKLNVKNYFSNYKNGLCKDCERRLIENPLRLLDCKIESCKEIAKKAPSTIDSLKKDSKKHFEEVLEGLSKENINFIIDPHLVRGLDYYQRTVFEFVADIGLGAQNAIAAGGRYDGLFQTLGHKLRIPAIGCAGGIERMVLLIKENGLLIPKQKILSILGADDFGFCLIPSLAFKLRNLGINTDFSMHKKSLKSQMRRADKLPASHVMIIGEREIKNKEAEMKSLRDNFVKKVVLEPSSIASLFSAI